MAFAQSPNTPEISNAAEQTQKYQAFIFSIPVLFCIILFMLLYLFYLKKQSSSLSHPQTISPPLTRFPSFSYVFSLRGVGSINNFMEKLPTIVFDEELKARDSLCCVCLGEFEIKEELIQVPLCKHIFHDDCIHNWLISNTTCPLCRCSVFDVDNNKLAPLTPSQISHAVVQHMPTSDELIEINLTD